MSDKKYLWGQTHCPGARIKIFADPALTKGTAATTDWQQGVCSISLTPSLLTKSRKGRLDEVLFHEFVHVVEYLNDPTYLDPTYDPKDQCTHLAQTLEAQLWPLLKNLKRVRRHAGK
jgi:hypothetical protein